MQEEINLVQPEAIIHLAAKSFIKDNDIASFQRVNVEGTSNLLDAIAKSSALRHLH